MRGNVPDEEERRGRRLQYGLGAGLALMLLGVLLRWAGLGGDAAFWVPVACNVLAAGVLATALTRYVRRQRAAYWRERSRLRGS